VPVFELIDPATRRRQLFTDTGFGTANNKHDILEPLLDRFETYFTEYTDDEFREIAVNRLRNRK